MQILIVDDNDLVRSGLLLILSSEAGLNVVGECRNGYEAIDFVE